MVPRGLAIVAALLFATALSGCFADDAVQPASTVPEDAILVTAENDEETLANESFMMAEHVHDYWGGKDRLVVADEERDAGATWMAPYWAEPFVPADDVVVPQGTASVEVTLEWTDTQGYYTSPELWVKTAGDNDAVRIGPIASGDTLTIPTTLANADLPHQSISAWRFELRLHPSDLPTGMIYWVAHVKIHAEAVRGLEIPVYPPHPDLWDGKSAIVELDEAQENGIWIYPLGSCLNACDFPAHHPPNGTIVPFDAKWVDITIQKSGDSPTDLGVRYHGADTRTFQEPAPVSADGSAVTYRIELVPGMGDSPYASQSVWEFQVYVSGPVQKETVKIGSYRLMVTASK